MRSRNFSVPKIDDIDPKVIVRYHMDALFHAECYLIGIALATYALPRKVLCAVRDCTK
jgi:hypothetical protein